MITLVTRKRPSKYTDRIKEVWSVWEERYGQTVDQVSYAKRARLTTTEFNVYGKTNGQEAVLTVLYDATRKELDMESLSNCSEIWELNEEKTTSSLGDHNYVLDMGPGRQGVDVKINSPESEVEETDDETDAHARSDGDDLGNETEKCALEGYDSDQTIPYTNGPSSQLQGSDAAAPPSYEEALHHEVVVSTQAETQEVKEEDTESFPTIHSNFKSRYPNLAWACSGKKLWSACGCLTNVFDDEKACNCGADSK